MNPFYRSPAVEYLLAEADEIARAMSALAAYTQPSSYAVTVTPGQARLGTRVWVPVP